MSIQFNSNLGIQSVFNFQMISFNQIQRAQNLLSRFFTTGFNAVQPNYNLAQTPYLSIAGLLPPPAGYSPVAVNSAIALLNSLLTSLTGGRPMAQYASELGTEIPRSNPNPVSMGYTSSIFSAITMIQLRFLPVKMTTFMGSSKVTGKDKFAGKKSCRGSKVSNLNNSDHIKLALWDMKKKGKLKGNFAQIAKVLKEEYGINAKVEGRSIKFENGAILADSNGDGILTSADYNFSGAIKDLEKRWGGMKSEDIIKSAKNIAKTYGVSFKDAVEMLKTGSFAQGFQMLQTAGIDASFLQVFNQFQNFNLAQRPFFPLQDISMMFLTAWVLATPQQFPG